MANYYHFGGRFAAAQSLSHGRAKPSYYEMLFRVMMIISCSLMISMHMPARRAIRAVAYLHFGR